MRIALTRSSSEASSKAADGSSNRKTSGSSRQTRASAASVLVPLFLLSVVLVNAQAVTSVTSERDGRALDLLLVSDLTGNHSGPKGLLDIVSCFYWFRKYYLASGKELVPGETYKMMTWFADELYPIILRYKGKETIRIKGNRIECYRFHPVTEVGRVFKTEEDMAMWFTADENFLPVKIRFDIFVGSFYVDMTSYEGLRAPLRFID